MRFRSIVVPLLAFLVVVSALYLWQRPRPEGEGADREQAVPPIPAPERSPAAPPQPAEVQPLLDLVFAATVVLDQAMEPPFVAGDFNGDEVTDLAAAVKPRGAEVLPQINDTLAAWSLQDALAPPDEAARPGPVTVAAGDRLLAVVHGMSPGGWRHPEARQGYLVTNAVGPGMTLRPMAEAPDSVRRKVYRPHLGDVIAQRRDGRPGLIFWTGAAYAWAATPSSPPGTARR